MKLKEKLLWLWNFWPPFFCAGIRIQTVSSDYKFIRVELPLRFWNSNYVGTQFGGSMFAMTDPFYMVMLLRNLGKEYVVWDKSASIKYIKPGKSKVWAEFKLTDELIQQIKEAADTKGKVDWNFMVSIQDINNEVIAEVEKVVYVRSKRGPRTS